MEKLLYIKAAWLYIIGVAVIIIGLYMFFTAGISSTESIQNAFYLMFSGFAVSMFGGVYGRRVIKSPDFRNAIKADMERREAELKQKAAAEMESKTAVQQVEAKPAMPAAYAKPQAPQATAAEPAAGPIKVIICPHCGEENKYAAVFCDECGKRLRPKKVK